MKLIKKTTLLAGIALLMACNLSGQWGKRVKGNGNEVTIERSVGSYDAVALSGWFDVDLVSGSEGSLTLTGEENLLEHVVTEVKNGKLQIRTERGYQLKPSSWKTGGIRITVPVESIEEVTLSGSGDIVGKTPMKAERFRVGMTGSGDINIEVDSDDMEATLSGSGDIELSGSAKRFEVRVSGSGDVKAFDLDADEVEANVSGSADIRVRANEVLIARVSGSGDIHYKGNPSKVDSKTSGSGDITKS